MIHWPNNIISVLYCYIIFANTIRSICIETMFKNVFLDILNILNIILVLKEVWNQSRREITFA